MSDLTKRNLKLSANILLNLLFVILGGYLFIKGIFYFMPFVIGYIIALIGSPLVRLLEKHLKIRKKIGSVIIMILVIALIVVIGYFAGLFAVRKASRALAELPQVYDSFLKDYGTASTNMGKIFGSLPTTIQRAINEFLNNIGDNISKLVSGLGSFTVSKIGDIAAGIPMALITFIVTVLSSYYFMSDQSDSIRRLRERLPKSLNSRIDLIKKEVKHGIGGYFKAQLKIGIVIYIVLMIGLLIVGAAYAPLVALLVAFLDILPVLGTGFVLVPWAIFKLFIGNYFMALGLVILYIICLVLHQFLQPKMIGDTLEMPAMLTLLCVFLGFKISGIIGMIVAVIIGLILWKLYNDGALDEFLNNIKELWDNVSKAIDLKEK